MTGGSDPGFRIYPAIDLKDGKCVRLRQGRAEDATVYGDDPVAMALHWQAEGASYLHMVDLDGAFQGRPAHTEVIRRVVDALDIPVQVGGGIRTDQDLAELVAAGVDRAILGTRAFREPDALGRLVAQFGDRVAVGIDARDGQVQITGWTETTSVLAVDLARLADAAGVATLIYTDTARDGMLGGPNVDMVFAVARAAPRSGVIASGGVSTEADIQRLTATDAPRLDGAIVGKALYERTVTLAALHAARRPV